MPRKFVSQIGDGFFAVEFEEAPEWPLVLDAHGIDGWKPAMSDGPFFPALLGAGDFDNHHRRGATRETALDNEVRQIAPSLPDLSR